MVARIPPQSQNPRLWVKHNKNRYQYAGQVQKLLEYLEPQGFNIDILSQDEGCIVWNDLVDPKMEQLICGMIRRTKCFLTMSQCKSTTRASDRLAEDVMLILLATIRKVKGWRKTVDLEMRPQRSQKRLD